MSIVDLSIGTLSYALLTRTRLIGMAALIATVNSEALHNTIGHFGTQASTILRPILIILFDTPTPVLEEQ